MKRKNKIMLITVVGTLFITSMSGCAGCNKNTTLEGETPTTAVTIRPVTEPIKEVVPTIEPMIEPVFTATIVPTPTEVPVTPTLMPTATLKQTNIPLPTVTVVPEAKLLDSVKMGDMVWYDFYDDGTLIVRGIGKTRDVDAGFDINYDRVAVKDYMDVEYNEKVSCHDLQVKKIVVEEGIVELGAWSLSGFCFTTTVLLPTTLNKIGYAALYGTICSGTECFGLRTDIDIGQYALANFFSTNENLGTDFKKYTVAPTLKQLPTATPLPNPDKPRKAATLSMGNNITYEFWDNGVMYVKGNGNVPDQSELFLLDMEYWNPKGYLLAKTTHTVIVEEGITRLGSYCLNGLFGEKELYLPTTLIECESGGGESIYGYYKGKKFTAKASGYWSTTVASAEYVFDALENPESNASKTVIITWE